MIYSRKFYSRFKSLLGKVTKIQKIWRNCLAAKQARQKITQSIHAKIEKSKELTAALSKDWNIIKCCPRFEVHVCSYSLEEFKRITMLNLKERENCQITRIFRAAEIDTHVIYVLPYHLNDEVIRYYQSVFGFRGGESYDKVYFVVPENVKRL